jgi:beta-catenin-like protein 1
MTSIDELFKRPSLPSKRKLESLSDSAQSYKSAKLTANGDAKRRNHASVEEAGNPDDEEAGPELPPDLAENDGPDEDDEGRFFGSGIEEEAKQALDYLDTRDNEEHYVEEKIDSSWLRKLALNFEKRISKNAELRAKYEDDPQKFMGSEADLDADIKALSILSEHPELYEEFAKLGCVNSLVSLLAHENTDIAIDAIEMISELTDEDVQASSAQWDVLVDTMLDADLLDLLVSNFSRFDESVDADRSGAYHSLSVIENLASQPSTAERIGADTTLLSWLLKRIQKIESPLTQNKQYAAEILAILLQSSSANRKRLTELDGVDTLLQLLAAYRKRDPQKDSEEEEYVENLFDCLTCVVDEPDGKAKFVDAEGVELCLIMLREGKMSKPRALRVLDHAIGYAEAAPTAASSQKGGAKAKDDDDAEERNPNRGALVCEKLVEAAGLKTVFGMFMKRQDAPTTEHLLGILAALLRSLPAASAPRIRTLAKFVEKDYEKIGKLVALRRDYAGRVAVVNAQIKDERRGRSREEVEEMADEWFSRRLDAGLFCLQMVDVILAWLVAEDDGARKKIVKLLAERDEGLADLRRTLREQLDGMDEGLGSGEAMLRDMLETLIGFLE